MRVMCGIVIFLGWPADTNSPMIHRRRDDGRRAAGLRSRPLPQMSRTSPCLRIDRTAVSLSGFCGVGSFQISGSWP
jgi:hypothetical protein